MASIKARYANKELYVIFRFNGKQYFKKSGYACLREGKSDCTCAECVAAHRLGKSIQDAIDLNLFKMDNYFKVPIEEQQIDKITFKEYAYNWLELNVRLTHSTQMGYESKLSSIFQIIDPQILLKDLSRLHIKKMIKLLYDKGCSPKHINHRTGLISTIMNDAINNGILTKNPAYKLALPNEQKELTPLAPEQMIQIFDYIRHNKPSLLLYFAIGFFTGARSGEILALRKQDIDLEANVIRFGATVTVGVRKESTKTNNIRYVEIMPPLKLFIFDHFEYMEQNCYAEELFWENDKPITKYRTISKYWKPALEALGIAHQRQYELRHAFASNMLAVQIDDSIVAGMLGHSSLKMLHEKYGKWIIRRRHSIGEKFEQYLKESVKSE